MIDLTKADCKQGAEAALNLILQSRSRKLRRRQSSEPSSNQTKLKMPKNIEDVPDDMDDEQQAPETAEERQQRLAKIKDELTGDKGQELVDQIRQEAQYKKDMKEIETQAKLKAQKDAIDKIKNRQAKGTDTLSDISVFKSELLRCIGDQMKVSRRQADTYNKPNAKFAGTNLMVPVSTTIERFEKPIINVYFDKSGSISERSLQKAVDALKDLDIYRRRKMCDYHIFFFASKVSDDANDVGAGTTAFPEILAHLKKTKANNAIIITDSDFDYQTEFKTIEPMDLKGCVWWFWHMGEQARLAYAYLQGKRGTFQYKVM